MGRGRGQFLPPFCIPKKSEEGDKYVDITVKHNAKISYISKYQKGQTILSNAPTLLKTTDVPVPVVTLLWLIKFAIELD